MLLVREKRTERGLTQAELAKLSGVSQQNISLIENKQITNVGILTLEALSKALKCKVFDLYKPDKPAA